MRYLIPFLITLLSGVSGFASSVSVTGRADTAKVVAGRHLQVSHVATDTLIASAISSFAFGDSVYTGYNAQNSIFVDLDDPLQMWDLPSFMQQIRDTSWYAELGAPPIHGAMWIDEVGDNLVWWDRESGAVYMNFTEDVNNNIFRNGWLGGGGTTPGGLTFLDGKIYLGYGNSDGVGIIDLVRDRNLLYFMTGMWLYKGDVSERNDSKSLFLLNSSPAIVNNSVNAIAACRDPELVDEFGRPKHWWVANTDGGVSVYSPVGEAIYDSSTTFTGGPAILLPDGLMVYNDDNATREQNRVKLSIFTISADAWGSDFNYVNAGVDGTDLAWTNAANFTPFSALEGKSIAGDGSPMIVFGSNEGLYVAMSKVTDSGEGALIRMAATLNTPLMVGDIRACWPLKDIYDYSPAGHTLTNNNTVTFHDGGPAGSYANFVAASSMSLTLADHADLAITTGGLSIGGWIYRDVDSGGIEGLVGQYDTGVGADEAYGLYIAANDLATFITKPAGAAVLSVGPAIALSTWYHIVGVWDGSTQYLYLNGELVDSDTQAGPLTNATCDFTTGAMQTGGVPALFFDGRVGGAFLTATAMTQAQIRYEYQRGLRRLNSTIDVNDALPATDVDAVCVDPHGHYFGVVAGDKLTIFDEFANPVIQDTYPGTTLRDAWITSVPGTKTPTYGMFGSDQIEFVHPEIDAYRR